MCTRTVTVTTAPEVPNFSAEEIRRALLRWQSGTEVEVRDVTDDVAALRAQLAETEAVLAGCRETIKLAHDKLDEMGVTLPDGTHPRLVPRLNLLAAQLAERDRQLEAARDALKKYGRHSRDCRVVPAHPIMKALGKDPHPCTCGLAAVLSAPAAEQGAEKGAEKGKIDTCPDGSAPCPTGPILLVPVTQYPVAVPAGERCICYGFHEDPSCPMHGQSARKKIERRGDVPCS